MGDPDPATSARTFPAHGIASGSKEPGDVPRAIGRRACEAGGPGARQVVRAPIGRPPRPILLFIVYGVFLVIVGVTATAQVMLASVHVSTSALNQAVGTDTQVVRGFVDDLLTPARPHRGVDHRPSAQAALEAGLHVVHHAARHHPGRDPAPGRHDPRQQRRRSPGFTAPDSADWRTALAGQTGRRARARRRRARPARATSAPTPTLREYFPLLQDGRVVGVVGVVARRHADHDRDRRRAAGRRRS